ncbi:hypothetical protein [Aquisphaera insulae]|uniref:hypothetical protein n=1 Tax=Aquisphaera insulae TaxID=2712864 RepID=UPI0013ED758E|nr:hypothetical protein [Aquisphaera insulae]
MRIQPGSRAVHAALMGGLVVAVYSPPELKGQERNEPRVESPRAPASGRGMVSGVILRAEPVGETPPSRGGAWRLTVNTDVVWRDFVRDQATGTQKAARTGVAKAAEKGKASVAAEGHPQSKPLVTAFEVDRQTEITVRYRSSTDSISDGAPTADGAAALEEAADRPDADRRPHRDDATSKGAEEVRGPKARALEPMELKPGLWVEVDSRLEDQRHHATRIRVLRPVGGPDVSPGKEKERTTKKVSPGP